MTINGMDENSKTNKLEQEDGKSCLLDLPVELLGAIMSRLIHRDQICFSSICKKIRSSLHRMWHPTTPCLLVIHRRDGRCMLFDPAHKKTYTMSIPHLSMADILYSDYSWLLLSRGLDSLFFYNPFTKELINLPKFNFPNGFSSICFSGPPKSADCIVFAIQGSTADYADIFTCHPGDAGWTIHEHRSNVQPFLAANNNSVFYNDHFYCLGKEGNLGVFNAGESVWTILQKPQCLGFKAEMCFLMVSDGELFSVFMDYFSTPLHVFRLDCSKMEWEETTDLGDRSIFVSQGMSFCKVTGEKEMKNKILFPGVQGDCSCDPVFYCMMTGRENFVNSKLYFNCTWIEPRGLAFEYDKRNNQIG